MRNIKTFSRNSTYLMLLLVSLVACSDDQNSDKDLQPNVEPGKAVQQENNQAEQIEEEEEQLVVTYHLDSLKTKAEVDTFQTKYTDEEQRFIFAINRVDARRLNAGDLLVIPDTLTGNFIDYAPFPKQLEMLGDIPKTVLISRRIQAFGTYEGGKLKRWGPVSSGKQSTPTPAGLNYGNYKARKKVSTVDDSWLMPYYFNFMNFEGVGTHEYSMPGYPASHACVRLRKEDAMFVYDWAQQWELNENGQEVMKNGTPFMVFGDYDYKGEAPWLGLAKDAESNFLSNEELKTLKDYVSEYHKDEKNFRKEKAEASIEGTANGKLTTIN